MRVVVIGASEVGVHTARLLIDRGYEVVLIEADSDRIDQVSEDLDCGFLHGDGSNPSILKEAAPTKTDVLYCLTNHDQANIIAGLVGRSLGFQRVVTSIANPAYEAICLELGLKDTVIPSRTIARYLADVVGGGDVIELSTVMKDDARMFTFTATGSDARPVRELELPEGARVVGYYRDEDFDLASEDTKLEIDDEVIVLTHSEHMPDLRRRWNPKQFTEASPDEDGEA